MSFQIKSSQKSFDGIQGVYSHQSLAAKCEMEFSVYVPEQAKEKPHPVLFYLSGLTCTQDNVTTKSGFQQAASQLGVIVVCPDTSPRHSDHPMEHDHYDFGSGAGFYVNATQKPWSENYQMYDYVATELPELIAEHFPIDATRMGIFGHSMGGHGALTIGLKHPDIFKSISAFSPIVAPMQCPWGQNAFSGYLGNNKNDWKSYDATQLIYDGYTSKNSILIDQGDADDFLSEQLKPELFETACKKRGQALTLRLQSGFDHSYYFISSFMQEHVEFHASNLTIN